MTLSASPTPTLQFSTNVNNVVASILQQPTVMQQDSYGALVKKKASAIIPLNTGTGILNGRTTHEKIFAEIFEVYAARRLVLMTHMRGSSPRVMTKNEKSVLHQRFCHP